MRPRSTAWRMLPLEHHQDPMRHRAAHRARAGARRRVPCERGLRGLPRAWGRQGRPPLRSPAKALPTAGDTGREDQPHRPRLRNVKTPRGYVQGYNAQAVTNEHQIVIAAELSADSTDSGHLEPMVSAAKQSSSGSASATRRGWSSPMPATGTRRRWRPHQWRHPGADPRRHQTQGARPGGTAALRVHAPRARDRPRRRALPKTPGDDRTGLRGHEVQPAERPLPTQGKIGVSLRVAADHGDPQPAKLFRHQMAPAAGSDKPPSSILYNPQLPNHQIPTARRRAAAECAPAIYATATGESERERSSGDGVESAGVVDKQQRWLATPACSSFARRRSAARHRLPASPKAKGLLGYSESPAAARASARVPNHATRTICPPGVSRDLRAHAQPPRRSPVHVHERSRRRSPVPRIDQLVQMVLDLRPRSSYRSWMHRRMPSCPR